MKIYFAGATAGDFKLLKSLGVKSFLISFAYMTENVWQLYKDVDDLFLDSGAFSAYTRNTEIDIGQYIRFIKNKKIMHYAGLDVIGNAEATKKNTKYMENKGLKPIPTFHRGSDMKYLIEMAGNHKYIAFGGMASNKISTLQKRYWLDRTFKFALRINPKVKIHGFGCTALSLISEYPWYSVDSTTWNVARRFGEGYDENLSRVKKQKFLKEYHNFIESGRAKQDLFEKEFDMKFGDFLVMKCAKALLEYEKIASKAKNKNVFAQGDLFDDL